MPGTGARSRTGRRGGAILVLVVLAASLLLVTWAAANGPGDPAHGGRGAHFHASQPTPTPSTNPSGQPQPEPHKVRAPHQAIDLSWVGTLIDLAIASVLLWLLWLAVRSIVEHWLERVRDQRVVAEFDVLPDVERAREQLRRDHDRQLDALAGGSARNGIVACWVMFEDSAVTAGAARRPSETSSEFVTRFLHQLDVDPRSAGTLAQLFHEARFSTHALPEEARDRARAALDQVQADLAGVAT